MKRSRLLASGAFVLTALIVASNPGGRPALAAACKAPATEWRVTGHPGQVNVLHSLPSAKLPDKIRKTKGGFRAGLTAARFTHRIDLTVENLPRQPGCYRLAKVSIQYGIQSPIRVLIASELVEGSCPYQVTLDHEFRHVEIARNGLRRMVDSARKELPELVGSTAIRAPSLDRAKRIFDDTIIRIAGDAARRFADEAKRQHRLIDTPEAYRQEQAKCPISDWNHPFRKARK